MPRIFWILNGVLISHEQFVNKFRILFLIKQELFILRWTLTLEVLEFSLKVLSLPYLILDFELSHIIQPFLFELLGLKWFDLESALLLNWSKLFTKVIVCLKIWLLPFLFFWPQEVMSLLLRLIEQGAWHYNLLFKISYFLLPYTWLSEELWESLLGFNWLRCNCSHQVMEVYVFRKGFVILSLKLGANSGVHRFDAALV